MLGNYQVLVINPATGEQIDMLTQDRFQSLTYSRKLNDWGRFSMTVRADDPLATLRGTVNSILDDSAINTIFEIYRDSDGTFQREETYLLRLVNLLQDENSIDWLIIAGDSILKIFDDVTIVPEDDPDGSNGYSTKSGAADLVMSDFVLDQCIAPFTNTDRTRDYIINAPSEAFGQDVFARVEYQSLLKTLQDLTVQGAVDFALQRTTGAVFQFIPMLIGRDLTYAANYPNTPYLLFSPELGNLKNPNLTIDRNNNITVTYVATQGIQEDRLVFPVASGDETLPLNRRENVIDARQLDDGTMLADAVATSGAAELRDKQPVITFDFDIDTNASGARYQVDWVLGDRITARYLTYQEDLRIVEVELEMSGSSERITPKFQKLTTGVAP